MTPLFLVDRFDDPGYSGAYAHVLDCWHHVTLFDCVVSGNAASFLSWKLWCLKLANSCRCSRSSDSPKESDTIIYIQPTHSFNLDMDDSYFFKHVLRTDRSLYSVLPHNPATLRVSQLFTGKLFQPLISEFFEECFCSFVVL